MIMSGLQPIRAIERGVSVMRALETHGAATLHDLHIATKLHRTTLLRILLTLEQQGLVRRGLSDGLYRNTFELRRMTDTLDEYDRLAEIAGPVLGRLCARVKWPTDLMVRNGNFMEIKETSRLQSPFIVNRDGVGYRVGLPMTAVGRAYLAFCPETERAEILAALRKTGHPADHPVKNLRDFHGVLETIRAQGYAMRDSSYQGGNYTDGSFFDDGLNAIAVALQGPDKVLGCINLLWVRQAVPSKQFVADNLDDLATAAEEIVSLYLEG
jgi:IclR family mhp operon transcriptional activator